MKRLTAILLCLIMLFALTACGGKRASDAEPPVALRLSHTLDEEDKLHLSMCAWAEAISEATEGSVQITVEPIAAPGTEADCLDLLRAGEIDMTLVPYETLRAMHSEWSAISMPYIFSERQQFFDVMDSEIAEDLYALTEAEGFLGLTWIDHGARSFYTAKVPLRTPGDFAGLRIAAVNDDAAAMIDALGATAVPMKEADVPAALLGGEIDGAENDLSALEDQTDGVRYFTQDEHSHMPSVLVVSVEAWNRLSAEQQAIVKSRCEDLSGIRRAVWSDHEAVIRVEMKEDKVTIIKEIKSESFRAACGSVYEQLQSTDPAAYAFVERIQDLID